MQFRFLFEGAVGVILFGAVLIWGEGGMAALALLALVPVVWGVRRVTPDERELQLFYKINNWAFAFTVLALVVIYEASGLEVFDHLIGKYWMPLSIAALLIGRGAIALYLFETD